MTSTPPVLAQSPALASCNGGASVDRPVSVVSSGGVSKGAYQAGVLWALLQYERAIRQRAADSAVQIRSFAGASAGNLNSLLGAIEWATPIGAARTETHSMLWRTWMHVGVSDLLPDHLPADSAPRSMLRAEAFDPSIDDVVRLATAPLLHCDLILGNTMTRADAASAYPIRDVRDAQVLRHAMIARFNTGMDGMRVSAIPRAAVTPSAGVIITPAGSATGEVTIRDYIESVKASAAFPLAFPPRRLRYARLDGGKQPSAGIGTFLDGAVFDNEPLSLGLDLLMSDGTDASRCSAERAPTTRPSEGCRVAFISANPRRGRGAMKAATDRTVHGASRPADGATDAYQLLDYASLLVKVVSGAADYELFTLERRLQERGARCAPGNAGSLCFLVTSRFFPIFGEKAVSFGAFLGRPLRELDFYIGAYDGVVRAVTARHCEADRVPDNERATCIQHALASALVEHAALPELSETGRTILTTLAQLEHAGLSADALPNDTSGLRSRRTADLLALLMALREGTALADSLVAQRTHGDVQSAARTRRLLCPRPHAMLGPLCDDGLLYTLRRYAPLSSSAERDSLTASGTPDEAAFYRDAAFERLRARPEYEVLRHLRRATDRVLWVESDDGWELGRIGLRTIDFLLGKEIEERQVGLHSGSTASFSARTASSVPWMVARQTVVPMTVTGGISGALTLSWQPLTLSVGQPRWTRGLLAAVAPTVSVTRTDARLRPSLGLRMESHTHKLPLLGGTTFVVQGDLCLESRCTRGPLVGALTVARRSLGLGVRWLPAGVSDDQTRREAVVMVHDVPALLGLIFGR